MELIERTKSRNRALKIAGTGAFVRAVKEIKQVKSHHLAGTKPSSLYYEFILHEGFGAGDIAGESWADLTSSALTFMVDRLNEAHREPVRDPILNSAYDPAPTAADLSQASKVFDELARRARFAARTEDRCRAAIEWRYVFGGNAKLEWVFPLPPGCRSTGAALGATAVNVATGGTRERSFG